MFRWARENLKIILVAMITAMVTAGAPAVAHGVRHALFAHNADKLDGIDSRALQKKCKDGSVLAFARIDPADLDSSLSTAGITAAYNCASPNRPAEAFHGASGTTYVRFPGLMDGYESDTRDYVVSGNAEGIGRLVTFNRSATGSGEDATQLIEARIWNTLADPPAFDDVPYTITLFKVAR